MDHLKRNIFIKIDKEGKIEKIFFKKEEESFKEVIDLGLVALLPGFVNVHSHAFHRELRGLSQIGECGGDNFWKWRENMYKIVENIDYEKMKQICVNTFEEMLSAGITTVGEFHYVHHLNNSEGKFALDMAVVEAACQVGIRLVIIETLYMRGGFSQPKINPEQWRFASQSIEQFIEHVNNLKDELKNDDKYKGLITIALAVHSLRAVPITEAHKLYQFSIQNNIPLHLHLEEQPLELKECQDVHSGRDPGQVLLEDIMTDEGTKKIDDSLITTVHCTYSKRSLLDEFIKRGINICICPSTEGYLGDGIPSLDKFDNICLGTDCNNRIGIYLFFEYFYFFNLAMLEELRWLAFCQNMRTNSRNCASLTASKLLNCATINGAKSLGILSKIGDFL
ncbi:Amidohydro-rel domain-containing protein [Meloidogyne graminicola]|uniref:Amidohydro-rel domain-containing protein n=1 Tax=Meloidogyne graminicola TaxID=189291 RepID=A0A8T0A3A1_9BILA|nr:Amidohydro-rel domain-containing protein [Meloidogyne graminicola]